MSKELNQLKETISILIDINDITTTSQDSEFISGQNKAFNTVLALVERLQENYESEAREVIIEA